MAETGPAELRAIAARLRARLASDTSTGTEAYRLLRDDNGEVRPASDAAVALWEKGGGPWRAHHLAIAAHSRLYETGRLAGRLPRHSGFLAHWAEVHGDDAFWARMRDHLGEVMGAPFPEDVLASVRARLPRDLLAPHLTLAERAMPADPVVAAFHLSEIRRSGLPGTAVAEARRDFATGAVNTALVAAKEGRHNDALDALEPRLAADPDSPDLVRSLLFVARGRMDALVIEVAWHRRSGPFLDRVTELLGPYLQALGNGMPPPEIAVELARLEFFLGLELLQHHLDGNPSSATVLNGARTAAEHFERALTLNPGLPSVSRIYEDAEGCLTAALLTAARAAHGLGHGDAAVRRFLDRALRYRGALLEEANSRQLALIVVLDLGSSTRAELDLGDAVIDRLENDPGQSAEMRTSTLPTMRSLIAQRRRWAL